MYKKAPTEKKIKKLPEKHGKSVLPKFLIYSPGAYEQFEKAVKAEMEKNK
jgi:hypothetical protein